MLGTAYLLMLVVGAAFLVELARQDRLARRRRPRVDRAPRELPAPPWELGRRDMALWLEARAAAERAAEAGQDD